jgi:hypothetical protein
VRKDAQLGAKLSQLLARHEAGWAQPDNTGAAPAALAPPAPASAGAPDSLLAQPAARASMPLPVLPGMAVPKPLAATTAAPSPASATSAVQADATAADFAARLSLGGPTHPGPAHPATTAPFAGVHLPALLAMPGLAAPPPLEDSWDYLAPDGVSVFGPFPLYQLLFWVEQGHMERDVQVRLLRCTHPALSCTATWKHAGLTLHPLPCWPGHRTHTCAGAPAQDCRQRLAGNVAPTASSRACTCHGRHAAPGGCPCAACPSPACSALPYCGLASCACRDSPSVCRNNAASPAGSSCAQACQDPLQAPWRRQRTGDAPRPQT